jgi:hypothetical protein
MIMSKEIDAARRSHKGRGGCIERKIYARGPRTRWFRGILKGFLPYFGGHIGWHRRRAWAIN